MRATGFQREAFWDFMFGSLDCRLFFGALDYKDYIVLPALNPAPSMSRGFRICDSYAETIPLPCRYTSPHVRMIQHVITGYKMGHVTCVLFGGGEA